MRQPLIDLRDPGPNTRISWTYTDGTNHKFTHRSVYSGRIGADQAEMMASKLDENGEFVPDDVAMMMLQPIANGFFHPTADHAWHTLGSIETTSESAEVGQTIEELVGRWSVVKDWDADTAENRLRETLGPPPEDDDDADEIDLDPESFTAPKP